MTSAASAASLVDRLLPNGLEAFLRERRAAGDSFGTIADTLLLDYQIRVTGETIRRWYLDLESRDAHPAGADLDGAA